MASVRESCSCCLWLAMAVMMMVSSTSSFGGGARAQAPAPAATDCVAVLANLSPCLDYVTSPNATSPSNDCCTALAPVASQNPVCLCSLFNTTLTSQFGITVNFTRAEALPTLCKVSVPPPSACSALGIPVPGPASSTSLAPTTPSASAPSPVGAATPSAASPSAPTDTSSTSSSPSSASTVTQAATAPSPSASSKVVAFHWAALPLVFILAALSW